MEERKISMGENKTFTSHDVLNRVNIVLLVLFFFLGRLDNVDIKLYIIVNLLIVVNLFIYPLIEYRNSPIRVNNSKWTSQEIKLCLKVSQGLAMLFILFKTVFSKSIANERYYWLYNLMALYVIILFIVNIIIKLINYVSVRGKEKTGVLELKRNHATVRVVLALMMIFPIIQFYQPKKTLSPGSINLPGELSVMEYRNTNLSESRGVLYYGTTITDSELIENLQVKISGAQAENVRNLDRVNYEIRKIRKGSYYRIIPGYKDSNWEGTSSNNINDLYSYEILIYKNGEVILRSFPVYNTSSLKLPDIYRLHLSEEDINEIINMIESEL